MRFVPLLLLVAALAGCDATDPTPEAAAPDGSYVQGVATLPNGETVAFRTAGAGVSGTTADDMPTFGFGSKLPFPSEAPDEIEVMVQFRQPNTPRPVHGEFETRFWDPDREWIIANVVITNVPDYHDGRSLRPDTFVDDQPIGTVTVGSSPRRWLAGTFDLASYRYDASGDSTLVVRVVGEYEIPLNLTN